MEERGGEDRRKVRKGKEKKGMKVEAMRGIEERREGSKGGKDVRKEEIRGKDEERKAGEQRRKRGKERGQKRRGEARRKGRKKRGEEKGKETMDEQKFKKCNAVKPS